MKKIWYHTTVKEAKQIIAEGIINLPKKGNLNDSFPCIWLTSIPDWNSPPDVIYFDRRGFKGMPREQITCARIEILIDKDIKDWKTYEDIASLSQQEVNRIEQLFMEDGESLQDWFYSSKNIPANQWGEIEYAEGDNWIQFPPDYPSITNT